MVRSTGSAAGKHAAQTCADYILQHIGASSLSYDYTILYHIITASHLLNTWHCYVVHWPLIG
jgi:hypothetical protein